MTRVTIDGETYSCPFAGLFRPHTEAERSRMLASITAHGVRSPVLHYLSPTHGRAVLDGLNRVHYARELNRDVPVLYLGSLDDDTARALAVSLNLDRRHLTPDEQTAARAGRVARIAAARTAPAPPSLRTLARTEGVSLGQVQRDLAESGVSGDTPDPQTTVVTGSDGKHYPLPPPRPVATKAPPALEAKRVSNALARIVAKLVKTAAGPRLATLAEQHGVPLLESTPPQHRPRKNGPPAPPVTRWPALDTICAVLRDLT